MPGISLCNEVFLGIAYILILCYVFLGIAIIADIFMEAIEVITSKTTQVTLYDEEGNAYIVEQVFWNPTIANLTLMALGSSAPEILLSVIDTVTTLNEIPSELGPQSIVGSAAFNLLVISGVSIIAVSEKKAIADLGVFAITGTASMIAYLWMFIVLSVNSPDYVELWEAIVTLVAFVVLVLLAYAADLYNAKKVKKN
mmetsp:Transcript_23509/g.16688  ORF Transcript_23509/g.16688 Transcript_23509/m.16688 type:complete len:198 (+) Transcript_23509:272-865(+)